MATECMTINELKEFDCNIYSSIKKIRNNRQRADIESIYKEITKTVNFENLLKEHLAERLLFLTQNGNISNKKNRDKDSFQLNENLVDESMIDLLPSTQNSLPAFLDTPFKCTASKADSMLTLLNETLETHKPKNRDEIATNEYFIDQMLKNIEIEKLKQDLMKDIKCEIQKLISRERGVRGGVSGGLE